MNEPTGLSCAMTTRWDVFRYRFEPIRVFDGEQSVWAPCAAEEGQFENRAWDHAARAGNAGSGKRLRRQRMRRECLGGTSGFARLARRALGRAVADKVWARASEYFDGGFPQEGFGPLARLCRNGQKAALHGCQQGAKAVAPSYLRTSLRCGQGARNGVGNPGAG